MDRLSVGVEEEFLLVDPSSAQPVPCVDAVLAVARPCKHGAVLKRELQRSQVEIASPVCTHLAELSTCLFEARTVLACAAATVGVRVVPVGCPPFGTGVPGIQDGERFDRIETSHAEMVRGYQACGCHVHVSVPDREHAVRTLQHLRPWLATLLALSGNSPFAGGRDTGFDSWRIVLQSRFPGFGAVPNDITSVAAYDQLVDQLVATGVLVDRQMSFWLARPSEHLPTIELRVADIGVDVDAAVLQAGLTRALVATALAATADGREPRAMSDTMVTAAVWRASRFGLGDAAVDPHSGRLRPARDVVARLLCEVDDALAAHGDRAEIRRLAARTVAGGTGAAWQRTIGIGDAATLVDELAARACSFQR